ncbi:MAG TPA: hypothetical protein VGG72_28690 [Bryobacteraceae bacterium]|jgi:hypothetical protein
MTADERRRMIEQRREATDRKERLWCKDAWQLFDVVRVPVEALLLNVDNRRFTAERKLIEEKLGHSLDPENSADDELSVISILLDTSLDVDGNRVVGQSSKDYEALKSDWQRRKQERPFWIRPDGTVRNGNRRLAMLKRLRADGGLDGTEWVDAIILDASAINEHDLFEMEQREQLTEDFKVRYTDINLLLALRDAAISRSVDWADPESIDRVAGELQHVAGGDKGYAVIQLQAIRYMDAYLDDSNAPGQYQKLLRQVERFRDVGKVMSTVESDYPDDAADMLRLTFAMIRAGLPHDDIRSIRKMFIEDRERYDKLLRGIEGEEQTWQPPADSQLADPSLVSEAEPSDADENNADPPGPVVPNYPASKVKTRITNAIDGFRAAASLASTFDAASTLEQVINRLNALSSDPQTLQNALRAENSDEVRRLVGEVIAWSRNAEQLLGSE